MTDRKRITITRWWPPGSGSHRIALFLSLGLLLRLIWGLLRRPKSSTTTPKEIHR